MASTSDSPLQVPNKNFSADEKGHRANANAFEQFGNVIFLGLIPVGGVIGYAGSTAPAGFVECNGAALNRLAYKALFSIVGTTYGPGDGSTTFNVPTRTQASNIFGGNATAGNGMMLIRTGVY